METYLNVEFGLGINKLAFTKTFDLPFAPYFGLSLLVHPAYETGVRLVNDDYTSTQIYFNIEENRFEVYVRNKWVRAVSDDTIDSTLEEFAGWERLDTTDIEELKRFMEKSHKSRNLDY